jgi:putative membrane protein
MMRTGSLILGLLVLAAVWFGPLPQLARQAFFAHMAMHMGVVAIAAPLIALGISSMWSIRFGSGLVCFHPSRSLCWNLSWSGHGTLQRCIIWQGMAPLGLRLNKQLFFSAACWSGYPSLEARLRNVTSARPPALPRCS